SPAICQWYVATILSPIRKTFPDCVILHYIDDILLCAKDSQQLDTVLNETISAIEAAGFEIQTDKIQKTSPWNYLGLRAHQQTITPQQIVIKDNPKNLHDLQQLCGSINWICTIIGISSEDLALLFNLLRGDSAPNSPRSLMPEAKQAIQKVQEALSQQRAHWYEPSLTFFLAI
ncbi:POK8 protein, partial [Hylia prasina]|nr:POK8 protein [Hylia prasina]